MGDSSKERQPGIVSIVDAIARIVRVRRTRTDLHIRSKGFSAVGAEGTPELCVIIAHSIGVARAAYSQIVSAVVPDDRYIASCGIKREFGEELTVSGRIIVPA